MAPQERKRLRGSSPKSIVTMKWISSCTPAISKRESERCDDSLIVHRFDLYQAFQRAFVYTPGDNEWTDCHRVNNGQYNPLERLSFVRSVFFPLVGQTTGGQVRPVRSQGGGS